MPRTYPVTRLSYSSVKEYLGNPWRFYRIYVKRIATFNDSPSTLIGKAFHKCLELYYSSPQFRTPEGIEQAKEAGLQIIRAGAGQVDWGKTGSLEKTISDALQTIQHYFNEDPHYEDMGEITPEKAYMGRLAGFPVDLKAISDLTVRSAREVGIVDFKKVSQLSSPDSPISAAYMLQAWFNERSFFAETRQRAHWMRFHEVKTSTNKDRSSQVMIRTIDFRSPEWKSYEKIIRKLVKDMLKDISRPSRLWLPNISDMMAGEDSWNEWLAESVQGHPASN